MYKYIYIHIIKYTIIGAGPTGSKTYILGINGYNIDLIEQSSQLGGI